MSANYDWRAINTRMIMSLRPATNPVAIKYIKSQADYDAIPNLKFYTRPGSACNAIGHSAYFRITVALPGELFGSHHCGGSNGCQILDEEWLSGEALNNRPIKWHKHLKDSAAHMASMRPGVPEGHIGIATSPIDSGDIPNPDVISLQLLPNAAFHLLAGLVDQDYKEILFPFHGESTCADTWGYTFNTGKPGLSLGCRGDRSTGSLQGFEVRLTLTPGDLVKALDGVDRLAFDGLTYPYYPMSLDPDYSA